MDNLFTNIRISIHQMESVRAYATVKVADAMYITGMRVIDGKTGLFVSFPSKKQPSGEYKDICFPATREIRDQLQTLVLDAYRAELAKVTK